MLGISKKRKLKHDAVPTQFVFTKEKKERKISSRRQSILNKGVTIFKGKQTYLYCYTPAVTFCDVVKCNWSLSTFAISSTASLTVVSISIFFIYNIPLGYTCFAVCYKHFITLAFLDS